MLQFPKELRTLEGKLEVDLRHRLGRIRFYYCQKYVIDG
jgi:hypothetical protein